MELYWLLRLPHLCSTFGFFAAIFAIFGFLSIAFFFMSFKPKPKPTDIYTEDLTWAKPLKWIFVPLLSLAFFFAILSDLTPNKTDLALMMGWDALKSNTVQEVIEIMKDKIR